MSSIDYFLKKINSNKTYKMAYFVDYQKNSKKISYILKNTSIRHPKLSYF